MTTSRFLAGLSAALLVLTGSLHAQSEYSDQKIKWENDSAVYVIMKGGKFGLISHDKEIIPAKYNIDHFYEQIMMDGHAYFDDGAPFVLSLNGKYGIIDSKGNNLIPFDYDYILVLKNSDSGKMEYAAVEKDGKVALTDASGKPITGFDYDAVFGYYVKTGYSNTGTCVALKKGAKAQFYDPAAKKVVDAIPSAEPESKIVYYKGQGGIISRTGEILLGCAFDGIESANGAGYEERSQLVMVRKKKNYGAWVYEAGFVVPVDYENLRADFSHGTLYFMAVFNGKYGLMDSSGKKLTEFEFDDLSVVNDEIVGSKGTDTFSVSSKGKVTPLKK